MHRCREGARKLNGETYLLFRGEPYIRLCFPKWAPLITTWTGDDTPLNAGIEEETTSTGNSAAPIQEGELAAAVRQTLCRRS